MEECFDVLLNGENVGQVQLNREGLYIRVRCRCKAPEGKIWRLFAGNTRLGIPVPRGEALVLETRVAAKRLEEGCLFTLHDSPEIPQDRFVPLEEDKLLPELEKVRNSVFAIRDGVPGLVFPDS